MEKAPASLTQECATHWLDKGYGPGWDEDMLTIDPFDCAIPDGRFHLAQIRRMQAHLEADCPSATSCCNVCDRARETLSGCERKVLGRHADWGEFQVDFSAPLAKVLAGEVLDAALLDVMPGQDAGPLPAAALRLLRNAVFARHGRAFKGADLNDYFYGPDSAERFQGMTAPPAPDPAYTDARLTQTDRANTARIVAVESSSDKRK